MAWKPAAMRAGFPKKNLDFIPPGRHGGGRF
jgi:hypothetical protein